MHPDAKNVALPLHTGNNIVFQSFYVVVLFIQISSSASISGMHSISSSEDIKPPFGLRPMPPHSPGAMLSQKRLCVICGDRSSGE